MVVVIVVLYHKKAAASHVALCASDKNSQLMVTSWSCEWMSVTSAQLEYLRPVRRLYWAGPSLNKELREKQTRRHDEDSKLFYMDVLWGLHDGLQNDIIQSNKSLTRNVTKWSLHLVGVVSCLVLPAGLKHWDDQALKNRSRTPFKIHKIQVITDLCGSRCPTDFESGENDSWAAVPQLTTGANWQQGLLSVSCPVLLIHPCYAPLHYMRVMVFRS